MSLWGKLDNKLSDGTVTLNHANRLVVGSGTTFGINNGVGYAATGDVIRFGTPFGGSAGYFGEAVITGIGNTQELYINSTAGISPIDLTGVAYQITQTPKSGSTDAAFNKFSRGIAQQGALKLETTVNGNVAAGTTVITTTGTVTGNGIVVGDVVMITHDSLLPRPAFHKVNTIATNTIRVEGGLPTVKSEYRLAAAASAGDATLTIKEAPVLSFLDGGRFGAHLTDLTNNNGSGQTFGLGLAGINTAGIGTAFFIDPETVEIHLSGNVKLAANHPIDSIVTISRGVITGSKISVFASEDVTGDETQVVGVSTVGVQHANKTQFETGAGWVGVTTYMDMHGSLRVKKDLLVAMSGITTGNTPIYNGNPLA